MSARILIVEDEPAIRDLLAINLRHAGFEPLHAPDAASARAQIDAALPDLVLLDEPTSALDPISTTKIEELINELKHDYTIAIVTHNMQQAARISDFTAYMYIGELVEFGETNQIFIKPTKQATEDYITGRFG